MLDGFLNWFEENKVGIIGTLTLHTIVLFACTLMSLRTEAPSEQRGEMRVDLMPEEEVQKMVENMIRREEGMPENVVNLTSNITAQVRPHIDQQRLAESVEQDARALEKAEFDRLAQEREARGEHAPVTPELDPSKWEKELYMNRAEPARVEGAAIVTHDLKERVRGDGVPGYLCKDQGLVAIRVSVGRDGVVEKAEFDDGQSHNVNDCMLEQALRSAKRTRFNAAGTAPDPQVGTIKFMFLPQ